MLLMHDEYSDYEPEDNRRSASKSSRNPSRKAAKRSPFIRAENEDDDNYDPYSDRPAKPEPLFERDPWS